MLVFLSLYVMLSILLFFLVCVAASLFGACFVSDVKYVFGNKLN